VVAAGVIDDGTSDIRVLDGNKKSMADMVAVAMLFES
jgi:hypothetical protein